MECNKEEAIKAKGIAEKKMQNDDFEGARKIAQKGQQLNPELENISQLLTVCNVHCSARNKLCGSEMDWYGILQVERLADEVTIKKQYRKLALILHPDKNKFPGAEAAFKLIGEANMVLSDQGKRSLYDSKCRASMRTVATRPPPHYGSKQYVPPKPSSSNGRPAFWTTCPFCSMRYQYHREFVNRALRCQNCSKPFIAYDLGAQGVPPGSSNVQPAFPQQEQAQSQGSFKVGTGGFPPSHMGSQGGFSSKTVGPESVSRPGSTAEFGAASTNKGKEDGRANKEGGKEGVGSAKVDAVKPMKPGTSRKSSMKRGRKLVVESSESCDTDTSADTEEDEIIEENGGSSAGPNSGLNGVNCTRRSFRKRQRVSYNENLSDDDDFMSPLKGRRGSGSTRDGKEELEEAFNNDVKTDNSTGFSAAVDRDKEDVKRNENSHLEGNLRNRSAESAEHEVKGEEAVIADHKSKTSEAIDNSESDSDSDSSCAPDPEFYECPDPEFNDFDKDKEDNCFDVDQLWACYDTTDGMPRFYARIKKVFSPGFRLQITWLEPRPEDQREVDWFNEGLPVACGKFVQGNSERTTDRLSFSHQVHYEKGRSRCSYMIYPRKGETWALFKDWDISWSSDPENHKNYKFEFVEVVSDFWDAGIRVAYLDKVEGFVSVFQQTKREGIVSFLIPPADLLRFSHRIPSFKLIGTEREGVPEGSFELDPASLPTSFYESCNVNVKGENLDTKTNGSNPKSSENDVKSVDNAEKLLNTPNKGAGSEVKNDLEKEMFKIRRSPRELNKDKKHNQMNASQCPTQEGNSNDLHEAEDKKLGERTPSKLSTLSRGDEKINLPVKDTSSQSLTKSPCIPPSVPPASKILEEFHNFNEDKSEGKFQPGQLWALYSSEDKLPKDYVLVKKIESCPFRLHVAMLEVCLLSKAKAQAVCCGTFKIQTGKARIFSPISFSHVLKAKSIGKNRFEIYPKEGEIWALYKDWNADVSWSDLKKLKYEIVEVLEENEHCTKVSPLTRLNGFKSVFKAQIRQRSSSGVMEISRVELARFSHQIPSFKLTEEKDGCLKGCWELDPASIPDF